jgi:hypothetical protein
MDTERKEQQEELGFVASTCAVCKDLLIDPTDKGDSSVQQGRCGHVFHKGCAEEMSSKHDGHCMQCKDTFLVHRQLPSYEELHAVLREKPGSS